MSKKPKPVNLANLRRVSCPKCKGRRFHPKTDEPCWYCAVTDRIPVNEGDYVDWQMAALPDYAELRLCHVERVGSFRVKVRVLAIGGESVLDDRPHYIGHKQVVRNHGPVRPGE